MANSGDGSGSTRGRTGMVIDAVSGVIVDAKTIIGLTLAREALA